MEKNIVEEIRKFVEDECQRHHLGNEILFNHRGIERINQVEVATKERAFLDAVFLYRDYHFDNLRPLDWKKIEELKVIYQSKIFNRRLNDYYQIYKTENV